MSKGKEQATTTIKTKQYEVAMPLLQAMYAEFKELSKKKPDAALNKYKVEVVNRLLRKCREILETEPTLELLDILNEDDMPQSSDVIVVLSQYVAAMKQFKGLYYQDEGLDGWRKGITSTWRTSD